MSVRFARLERSVFHAVAELVPASIRDPRVHAPEALVVTKVKVSGDLSLARVVVTIKGDAALKAEAMEALRGAAGHVRRKLGQRVALRRVPQIVFIVDEIPEKAARVEEILRELAEERRARGGEGAPEGEPREAEIPDEAGEGEILSEASSMERVGSLAEVASHLRAAKRVLVTAHPHPDGDAAGSMSAAMLALIHLGKEVLGYNPDPIPDRLRFLPCMDKVVQVLPDEGFDTTLLLDCSDDRMFLESPPSRTWLGTVIALDHHKTASSFADLVVRDPTAAAAGVVLYRLLEKIRVPLSVPLAEALYCALISDTGSFRYQNTNPEAMKMGAALLDAGVDPWRVSSKLYESQPRGQLLLLGEVLRTLRVSDDGWVAVLTVTQEMLVEAGCDESHVDGFINFARGLRGVEVAVLVRVSDEHLRVGLRSRGNVDVSTIAESFGGGGHHNAAGFTVAFSPEALIARIDARVHEVCEAAGLVSLPPGER